MTVQGTHTRHGTRRGRRRARLPLRHRTRGSGGADMRAVATAMQIALALPCLQQRLEPLAIGVPLFFDLADEERLRYLKESARFHLEGRAQPRAGAHRLKA